MEQIIGTITLPLFILVALAVMVGVKPDAVIKPFFAVVASLIRGVFSLIGVSITGATSSGSTVPKPQPRYRKRPDYDK